MIRGRGDVCDRRRRRCRSEPLLKRKKLVERLVKGKPHLLYVDHLQREGLAMFGALALGLESIVAKDARSSYIEGPTENRFWLKIKNRDFTRKEPVEFRQIRHAETGL